MIVDRLVNGECNEWRLWLGGLVFSEPRFGLFLERFESKIKSKIAQARNDEQRIEDQKAELHIAWLITKGVPDAELFYEPDGLKVAGADYEVRSSSSQWRIEVRHLRDLDCALDSEMLSTLSEDDIIAALNTSVSANELADTLSEKIVDKIRQCHATIPTLLFLNTSRATIEPNILRLAINRILKALKEESQWIISSSNLATIEEVRRAFNRVSGIALLNTWPDFTGNRVACYFNADAQNVLPVEAERWVREIDSLDQVSPDAYRIVLNERLSGIRADFSTNSSTSL